MAINPGPRFGIAGGGDSANNRPTTSGGISGPFRARRGFDAHNHKGVNFEDPDLPTNLANPSGIGEVVNTSYFWDHASFLRWDGRVGFLPNPLTEQIVAGEQYAIRMDFGGRFLGRIAVWDGNLRGPASNEIPAGSVFGVNQLFDLTDPVLGLAEADAFVTVTEGDIDAVPAGDYVLNSTGGPLTVTAGGAAGMVVPAGDALLWLGDTRLGTGGWGVAPAPVFEFAHTGAAAVGVSVGNWRYLNTLSWIKALAANADQTTDVRDGDAQYTIEQQGKELKVWNNGAWHKIFSEVDVRAWIAALSLFEGTVQEVGGTTPNVLLMSGLPDLALNTQIDKTAHYWVFQGTPGYVIKAADPQGVGRDLPGTVLNPGDWLQVSNRSGDATNPDLRWSHVGGDLLAKSRGDNLYGLKPWAAGGWEIGSLAVHDQTIWRATGPVTAADIAPGTTPVPPQTAPPWEKVTLASGVRWVSTDTDLPASAPTGEIYFVLQSAAAGGSGGLFYWDVGNNAWQPLGGAGGGAAMDLTGGYPLLNVGVPIGTVIMWAAANPPPGYLICDGSAFTAAQYPELAAVLGVTNLPNLVGQFIRGAGANHAVGTRRGWTTARSRNLMTGWTNEQGGHNHEALWAGREGTGHPDGSGDNVGAGHFRSYPRFTRQIPTQGAHQHQFNVGGGGDAETAPDHVCLLYVIKASDIANRVRI